MPYDEFVGWIAYHKWQEDERDRDPNESVIDYDAVLEAKEQRNARS